MPAPTAGPHVPDSHVVRAGETLYSIAERYGLDYRDIARWNGIGGDYLIRPGDRLQLAAPGARRAPGRDSRRAATVAARLAERSRASAAGWRWPVDVGTVVGIVRQPSGGVGLRIDGGLNQPILAAADGKVVYTGTRCAVTGSW